MVIFHSYVKLPEGSLDSRQSEVVLLYHAIAFTFCGAYDLLTQQGHLPNCSRPIFSFPVPKSIEWELKCETQAGYIQRTWTYNCITLIFLHQSLSNKPLQAMFLPFSSTFWISRQWPLPDLASKFGVSPRAAGTGRGEVWHQTLPGTDLFHRQRGCDVAGPTCAPTDWWRYHGADVSCFETCRNSVLHEKTMPSPTSLFCFTKWSPEKSSLRNKQSNPGYSSCCPSWPIRPQG